jgi:hypothetical protein
MRITITSSLAFQNVALGSSVAKGISNTSFRCATHWFRCVEKTTRDRTADATHWSKRSMACAARISEASIRRIWHVHGLTIQALDRTQPGPPIEKRRGQTMTPDYKRHGTTTLFTALNIADGQVIGTCMDRHRHQEWLQFLRPIGRQAPQKKQLRLIVDNHSTHKHPQRCNAGRNGIHAFTFPSRRPAPPG